MTLSLFRMVTGRLLRYFIAIKSSGHLGILIAYWLPRLMPGQISLEMMSYPASQLPRGLKNLGCAHGCVDCVLRLFLTGFHSTKYPFALPALRFVPSAVLENWRAFAGVLRRGAQHGSAAIVTVERYAAPWEALSMATSSVSFEERSGAASGLLSLNTNPASHKACRSALNMTFRYSGVS